MKNFKLSRRDFLKVTGAIGMVTALGGIQALNTGCSNRDVTVTITTTGTTAPASGTTTAPTSGTTAPPTNGTTTPLTNKTTTSTNITTKATFIPIPTTNANGEVVILVTSAYAQPGVVNGRKFVWTNTDNKIHTITCDEYEPNFEFELKPGDSAHIDLSGSPGVFYYWCREHPNEMAEVVVQ